MHAYIRHAPFDMYTFQLRSDYCNSGWTSGQLDKQALDACEPRSRRVLWPVRVDAPRDSALVSFLFSFRSFPPFSTSTPPHLFPNFPRPSLSPPYRLLSTSHPHSPTRPLDSLGQASQRTIMSQESQQYQDEDEDMTPIGPTLIIKLQVRPSSPLLSFAPLSLFLSLQSSPSVHAYSSFSFLFQEMGISLADINKLKEQGLQCVSSA